MITKKKKSTRNSFFQWYIKEWFNFKFNIDKETVRVVSSFINILFDQNMAFISKVKTDIWFVFSFWFDLLHKNVNRYVQKCSIYFYLSRFFLVFFFYNIKDFVDSYTLTFFFTFLNKQNYFYFICTEWFLFRLSKWKVVLSEIIFILIS